MYNVDLSDCFVAVNLHWSVICFAVIKERLLLPIHHFLSPF